MYKNNKLIVLLFILILQGCDDSSSSTSTESTVGQAGSLSRFSIVDNYLYAISGKNIQLFDITTPNETVPFALVPVAFDIETLFSYNNALFIGAQNGVYIYDNSVPGNPKYISEFSHAESCDPVVISGSHAYITLRSANNCRLGVNQLDVLDVSDIYNPILKNTVVMQGPKGLGVDSTRLFVCDGIAGLKIFDLTDPILPNLIHTESDLDCYDVIANNGLLIVSDQSGLVQYQYDFLTSGISLLSSIFVE